MMITAISMSQLTALKTNAVLVAVSVNAGDAEGVDDAVGVGVGVENKGALQNRADNGNQGVMHHTIPEWRCADLTGF